MSDRATPLYDAVQAKADLLFKEFENIITSHEPTALNGLAGFDAVAQAAVFFIYACGNNRENNIELFNERLSYHLETRRILELEEDLRWKN